MRYELYGVFTKAGDNDPVGVFQSLKAAMRTVEHMDSINYPNFIILEKERKCSAPIGCMSGVTLEGTLNRAKSFVTGQNPVRGRDKEIYWCEQDHEMIDDLFGYRMTKKQGECLNRLIESNLLIRYNGPEYWDRGLIDSFAHENKLQPA